ncbi:nucleotidyltransferase domain-containing protein [Patescibacteria group bacterium]|nr:nucleotidyltransferase domain-containing protein [Patescibacteria group bacterium]MCG2701652.1 nucleotidyltransferase domain-containing protein [Candidatus Parcubacteria bacterium]MBU4210864.1 nucleotidyltransferase domain-containing protein [Patescibacteria group bacterium]MBU4265000.1 nucleotidyltransferase domain-containing protein [Patescibacteria group bacterium]MBU4390153.1 nucleotidyltransferase domain-containing protein [Patescibacteria group bacterium]
MIKKKYIDIAKKYAKLIENEGISVDGLYLFGSRIRGGGHKWSDLDVSVVSSDFGKDRIAEMAKLFYLASKVSGLIEPHSFSLDQFDDKYDSLAQEVKKTGVRVI